MNGADGRVIFEKGGKEARFPASLTKMATAAYVIETRQGKMDTLVEVEREAVAMISQEKKVRSNYTMPSWWLEPGASHMGLKIGEKVSIEDLVKGTLISSAGDACNVLALYVGGSVPDFMADLNEWLRSIGLQETNFNNPHGVHHPKHMTTAYDLALLTKKALELDFFRETVRQVRVERQETNKSEKTWLYQSNRLLKKGPFYYPPAIGVKTGYTQKAGFCLAAAAAKGGRQYILIMLGAPTKEALYKEAIMLFEKVFSEPPRRVIALKKGVLPYALKIEGTKKECHPFLEQDFVVEYYPMEEPKLVCKMEWSELALPIKKGERVGSVVVVDERGREYGRTAVIASENLDTSFWERLGIF